MVIKYCIIKYVYYRVLNTSRCMYIIEIWPNLASQALSRFHYSDVTSQIAKTLGSTSIRYGSKAKVLDGYLTDVYLRIFAICNEHNLTICSAPCYTPGSKKLKEECIGLTLSISPPVHLSICRQNHACSVTSLVCEGYNSNWVHISLMKAIWKQGVVYLT